MSTAADEKLPQDGKDLLFRERPPPYNSPEVDLSPPLQPPSMQPQQPWGPPSPAVAVQPTTVIVQPFSASSVRDNIPLIGLLPTHATFSHCANCNEGVTTRVVHKPSIKTHLWAFCLLIFGCLPCICIPYCMKSCLVADHYCTRCNIFLGNSTE